MSDAFIACPRGCQVATPPEPVQRSAWSEAAGRPQRYVCSACGHEFDARATASDGTADRSPRAGDPPVARASLFLLLITLWASVAGAQPSTLPLVQASDLTLLGSFSLPRFDGQGFSEPLNGLSYGGRGLGIGPDGTSLFVSCHDQGDRLARIRVPANGAVATVLEPCTPLAGWSHDMLGGSLWYGGKLTVTGYVSYDAPGTVSTSHYQGASLSTLSGPLHLAGPTAGWLGGYLGLIPLEWRAAFGGPALTGLCCVSIISRTSHGPTASVIDPAALSSATLVLGYDQLHPLDPDTSQSTRFNLTTRVGGIAFPSGTRSVLFFGNMGTGPYCYGQSCTAPNVPTGQGPQAYPYRRQVWAYDATDLLAVKAGTKKPYEVQPYAVWSLTIPDTLADARLTSATYDDATRRLYVAIGDEPTRVYVFGVKAATSPPPPACVPMPLTVTTDTTLAGQRRIVLEGRVCP